MPRKKYYSLEEICKKIGEEYIPEDARKTESYILKYFPNVEKVSLKKGGKNSYGYTIHGKEPKFDPSADKRRSSSKTYKEMILQDLLYNAGKDGIVLTGTKILVTFAYFNRNIYNISLRYYSKTVYDSLLNMKKEFNIVHEFYRKERNKLINLLKRYDKDLIISKEIIGVIPEGSSYRTIQLELLYPEIPLYSSYVIEKYIGDYIEDLGDEIDSFNTFDEKTPDRIMRLNKKMESMDEAHFYNIHARYEKEQKRFDDYVKGLIKKEYIEFYENIYKNLANKKFEAYEQLVKELETVHFILGYRIQPTKDGIFYEKHHFTTTDINKAKKEINKEEIERFKEYYKKDPLFKEHQIDEKNLEYIIENCLKIK